MKRVIVVLGSLLGLVLVLLILGAVFLNVDHYRPKIQASLERALNRPVELGKLHLKLVPFAVTVDGLTVQESAAFSETGRPFATAQEVYVSAGLMSLLKGSPDIHSITLQHPQVELVRGATGAWNFSDIGAQKSGQQSAGDFNISDLKIEGGQVAVTDERARTGRTVYNHIDATVSNFAPEKQFDVHVAGHFPGQGKEVITFKGKAGPMQSGNTSLNGTLSVQEVSLSGFNAVANGVIPPQTDAVASGSAVVQSSGDELALNGSLTLTNPVVRGTRVPYPIEAKLNVAMNQKTDDLSVRSGLVKVGPTAVSLAGEVNAGVKPAQLNLHVGTTNASIPELMNLAALAGASSNGSVPIKGNLTADLAVRGSATSPNVQGNLSSSSLQAQDVALTNVQARVDMQNGVLHLAPESAGIFGGHEDGDITLDTRGQHPVCHVKAKASGVDTNALLAAMSSVKDTLYGSLATEGDLSFTVDSGANLARTLNGTLGFNVTNGRLKNVNILNELSKVGKFLGTAPAQTVSGTELQKLAGTMTIQNGIASTNNLAAAMPEGSIVATGTMNLATEALDLHATAALAGAVSKAVGGQGIGGFLSTALANNKGELVIPVLITGTTSHPVFTPDMGAMAQMKLNKLLPTSGDPAKMTQSLIGSVVSGALGGGKQPGQQHVGGKQQQQQDAIQSILGAFGQKKR